MAIIGGDEVPKRFVDTAGGADFTTIVHRYAEAVDTNCSGRYAARRQSNTPSRKVRFQKENQHQTNRNKMVKNLKIWTWILAVGATFTYSSVGQSPVSYDIVVPVDSINGSTRNKVLAGVSIQQKSISSAITEGANFPIGSAILLWDQAGQNFNDVSTYFGNGVWLPNYNLVPGEAFFVECPVVANVNFVSLTISGLQVGASNVFIAGGAFNAIACPHLGTGNGLATDWLWDQIALTSRFQANMCLPT